MEEKKYEVIMCIVNAGYSSIAMDAAKKAGARGGTVIHGRGTANRESEAFFHIAIEPEKEIVIIIVPEEIKDNVLKALYEGVGLNTQGGGIAFSLSAEKVIGLS